MNYLLKSKKGDISLLVSILVCSILLAVLTPLAKKITVESNISRQNLMSQQAIQAAKTGLDEFKYNLNKVSLTGFDLNSSEIQKWPNINTVSNDNINVIQDGTTYWIELDNSLGTQYRIEYIPSTDTDINPRIISISRVKNNDLTIERALEESFEVNLGNCGDYLNGDIWEETCSSPKIGNITKQCNNGVIKEISNNCKTLVCRSFSGYAMGAGANNGSASTVDEDCENRGNGSLRSEPPYGATGAYIQSVSKRYCMSPSGYPGATHGDCNNRGGSGKCGCWSCQANGTECYYIKD